MPRYTATLPLHSRYTPSSETIGLAARHFALLLRCYTPTLVEYGYVDSGVDTRPPSKGFGCSECYSVAAESTKNPKTWGYALGGLGAATLAPGRVARTSPAHVTRTRSIACTMEVAR